MAKQIEHLSGRVKLRSSGALDSDRFSYLTLDQAEPNFGLPGTNGSLVISNTDGVRTFTTEPLLDGLSFRVGALDSADSASLYALFIKGSPLDGNVDSVGFRRLDGNIFEIDTLDTVTSRGNTTANVIEVGGLTTDSASIINLTVNDASINTLSAGNTQVADLTAVNGTFTGDLTVNGEFTVNGTVTTINSTTLTVNDKNIVLADSAPNAAAADSAGITVAGANATLLYKSATDTWNLNKAVVLDSSLSVSDKLFIGNVQTNKTNLSLYIDEVTGEVYSSPVEADSAFGEIAIASTDSNAEFYPVFVGALSGTDSANVDSNLSYNPSLNRLTLGRLRLTQLDSAPFENFFLTIDSNNVIGFKEVVADSEQDTLQTVTDRGDSTSNAITVRKLTTTDSALIGTDLEVTNNLQFGNQFLDGSSRRLVIYDSAGGILWG